jgi:hypothetical protein
MVDITLVLLILIFAIPLLMVFWTLISTQAQHLRICLIGLGLVMLGSVALVLRGEIEIDPGWRFMGEPITFSISNIAIWLYLATLLALAGLIWRERQAVDAAMTAYQWTLLNLSLSAGFVAFISGQFMIRYIALDVVGLLAALTVLSTFRATSGLRHFIIIFQILRLGDLSLLASILLLNHLTGTLEISGMIAAAIDLPINLRMWVFFGFLLALLIKIAIWPFGVWLERAHRSAPRVSFWISGLLLPALGYYLLYRIIPIIQSGAIFQNLVFSAALVLALLIILFTALQTVRFKRFSQVSGIMACFLLAGVAFGGGKFLAYYLLGLVLHRALLVLAEDTDSAHLNWLSTLFPLLINGLFIIFNIDAFPYLFTMGCSAFTILVVVWDLFMQRKPALPEVVSAHKLNGLLSDESYGGIVVRAAGWLNRTVEIGVLTHGLTRMSAFFHQIADWIYHNVEMGMEGLWIWIGRKLVQISEGTLRKVEVDAAQRSGDLMTEALHALERHEEKFRRKALRWDLAWIPLLLVVILIMLFVM